MTKLALLGCMVVLVFNVVNAVIPCGSQLGYDLSPISGQTYYDSVSNVTVRFCSVQPGCSTNVMSCVLSSPPTLDMGIYDAPETTWSYIQVNNPSAGVQFTTSLGPSSPYRSRWLFICYTAPALVSYFQYAGEIQDSLGPIKEFWVRTNLTCAPPQFPSIASSSSSSSTPAIPQLSSSSSAPVVPYSSTGLPGGIDTNCSSSQQRWYFSFMAMVSATHWVRFSGSFFTVVVPAGIKFMQVVSIDATWQAHMSGQSASYWVNTLDVDSHNLINVNGFNLFPLQGQALGFYVNGQLTVIGGSNPLPTVLSWSNTSILTSMFVYSQTMSDIFTGC